ncbi:hypothetical protein [Streptomyces sp. S3(2020)]|nr:hypothetical protein [Streptomyces sp. S3(2020)]
MDTIDERVITELIRNARISHAEPVQGASPAPVTGGRPGIGSL